MFFVLAGTFIALALWHKYILPRPASDAQRTNITPHTILVEFGNTFVSFFSKKGIIPALLFMLTYRLGESQLVKLASPSCWMGGRLAGWRSVPVRSGSLMVRWSDLLIASEGF